VSKRVNTSYAALYAARIALGVCTRCGNRKGDPYCSVCRQWDRDRKRQKRHPDGGTRPVYCAICGNPGHNATTCERQPEGDVGRARAHVREIAEDDT